VVHRPSGLTNPAWRMAPPQAGRFFTGNALRNAYCEPHSRAFRACCPRKIAPAK
jgi:hypothetical protein